MAGDAVAWKAPSIAGSTSYSNWDFYNFHVQQDLLAGQYVSAESTLIAAGPPSLSQFAAGSTNADKANAVTGEAVYPIGLLESFGIQQSKQLQRIFEIGSSRSYFIPGRAIGSITLGRTFYFGPSLLRILYSYYRAKGANGAEINVGTVEKNAKITYEGYQIADPQAALLDVVKDTSTLHQLRKNPGEDYFFIDLASDLFSQPHGLAVYFKDANFLTVGAFYLEMCYVQGHQMSVQAGSILIMEGASLQYDRMVPIKMTS